MRLNGSFLHWLPWNHGSQLNNLSASNTCSESSRVLSVHPGSSAGLCHCWAHVVCLPHTGKYRPCLPYVCGVLWWSPARRKPAGLAGQTPARPSGFTCSDSSPCSRILGPNWIKPEPPVTWRWLECQYPMLREKINRVFPLLNIRFKET